MRRTVSTLLIVLFCCSVALAGTRKQGDRELSFELGFSSLDLGSAGPVDLRSADGPRGALSFSWVRTRLIQLGIRASLTDFESDFDESIEGAALGWFFHLNVPTRGSVAPFAGVGISVPQGNLGARYEYAYNLSAGVRVYPSERFGFSATFEYQSYTGEDFVPDGNATSLSVGFLYKFGD